MPARTETPEERQALLSAKYDGMTHFESRPGIKGRPVGAEFLKGLAVGVPAFGPDLLGMINVAGGSRAGQYGGTLFPDNPPEPRYINNPMTGEPFTGDTLRELVNLDPESGWGMLGEGLGGWESGLAKLPAIGKAVMSATAKAAPAGFLAWMMSKNPTPGQVNSTFGEIGARNLLGAEKADYTLEAAKRRIEAGEDPLDVMVDNGWWQDLDGKWKFFASDANTTLNTQRIDRAVKPYFRHMAVGEEKEIPFTLSEIISPNSPILKAYPEAATMLVSISVRKMPDLADGTPQWKVYSSQVEAANKAYWEEPGIVTNPMGRVGVFHANDLADLKNSLFHEINHAIQFREGHAAGADAGAIMQYMSDFANSRLQKDVTIAAAEYGFDRLKQGGLDAIYEFLESYYMARNPDASVAEAMEFGINWSTYLEQGATKTAEEVQENIGFLNDIVRQNEILAARYLGLGGETQEQAIQAIRAMNDPELAQRAGQRYFQAGGERTSRMTEFFLDTKVDGIYDYFKRHGKMPYEMQEEIDKAVLRREGFAPSEVEAFSVAPEESVQLTTEKLKEKLTQPISMRSTRTEDIYFDDISRKGKQRIEAVVSPKSPRELLRWGAQRFKDVPPHERHVRTMRVNGETYYWDAREALHWDVLEGLGVDPIGKDGIEIRIATADQILFDDLVEMLE